MKQAIDAPGKTVKLDFLPFAGIKRKPRIHYPGAGYQVILCGNAGDPIFFEDRDRYRF